jgi:phosphomannomutase/phosphoglucomutase
MDQISLNPRIFRAYDIRGNVSKDLTPPISERIGSAYGTYLQRTYASQRVVVGRDNRLSSEALRDAFVRGVRATGVSVVDIGLSPSPLLYFAAAHWGIDGGANVTASHLPPEYNGFKLLERKGIPLGPQEIQALVPIAETGNFADGDGALEYRDPLPEYLAMLESRFRLPRPLRVVADPGNGVAAITGPEALRRIGCDVITINGELDGTFPAHVPNPQVPEAMEMLGEEVLRQHADLGVAWDADGDRLGVIDENGKRHESDRVLALFAEDVLTRHPHARIYVDVKISQSTTDAIRKHGGEPYMGPTGHSLIKRIMRAEALLLGGEGSGHLFFGEDYFGFDDAVFGACQLANIVARDNRPLSTYFAGHREYVTSPEFRLPCSDKAKAAISAAIADQFRAEYQILEVDGARIDFGNGWALVRPSNTAPELSVRLESQTKDGFDRIKRRIIDALRMHPEVDIGALESEPDH